MSETSRPWKIRSVQLDLARQMETPEFIKAFINFIAEHGYNSLVLYLEGRIRTKTFPFPSATESYSPEEMYDIVRHAASRGIEVIPAVASFGHVEHFLQHPELEHLAETRPPFSSRFGQTLKDAFCPSLPGTYEFLEGYFAEIAEIFPSAYFHACCDEIWDIACCDLCRDRLKHGETQGEIFARHLLKLHEIIAGKLGKRMIIWDDMFEYYPEMLPGIPRDIIMACWQYQGNVDLPRAHFFHRAANDTLANYDRLGFDYLICPAVYTIRNTESFTAYAGRHRPLGGLLTEWENRECFVLQDMPLIAAVGRFWSSGDITCDEAIERVCHEWFGVEDRSFISAIQAVCVSGLYRERRVDLQDYLLERENAPDFGRACLVKMLLSILPEFAEKVRESARPMLEEIILSLQSEAAAGQLEELLPVFFRDDPPEDREEKLQEICRRLETIAEKRSIMWNTIRPGIEPRRMDLLYKNYLANLQKVSQLSRHHGLLKVHFLLPDQYSAQNVRIFIRYVDSKFWEKVADGVFKETRHFDCFYAKSFLIEKHRIPKALKVETSGFGGQGFTYFEAVNTTGHYIPQAVEKVTGKVSDPEHLLIHDWRWAFAGEPDTIKNYFDADLAQTEHGFEIFLRKV